MKKGKGTAANGKPMAVLDAAIRAREEVNAAEEVLEAAKARLRAVCRDALRAIAEMEGGVAGEVVAHPPNPERRKRWQNRQKRRRSSTGELEACYRTPHYLAIARKEGTGRIDRSGWLWLTQEEQQFVARFNNRDKGEVKG